MPAPDKQALAIYEMLCSTSEDRPVSGNSIAEVSRMISAWETSNPALVILRESDPAVLLEFLCQSLDWLNARRMELSDFRISAAIQAGVLIALQRIPQAFANNVVQRVLRDFRNTTGIGRVYFPFLPFLAVLTREQITDDIRGELRKLHAQYAPSPTGKIDEHSLEIRNRIATLMHLDGEKQFDAGRGPWSQIVFDELQEKEPLIQAAWLGLLEHCSALEQTVPGSKWKKRATELMSALGEAEVASTMLRWLELGPTPGQPSEARSPIEDSAYQKGVVWCLALSKDRNVAIAVANFALACLRKIRMLGAVSQKVGFACVQALGAMECGEAVAQLARLRAKVRYTVALKLIEKSLRTAAERNGVSMEELEDSAIDGYGLNQEGIREFVVADVKATLTLAHDGKVVALWRNAEGKPVKAAPAPVRKSFPKEVGRVAACAKEIEQCYSAQRFRLESSLIHPASLSLEHWWRYFVDHPILGRLGRGLIWTFSQPEGLETSGIWFDGEVRDSRGQPRKLAASAKVRLWHPLSCDAVDVQRWRERIFASGIHQPFPQAFREYYEVTEADRETKFYSNRFAGIILKQHQFASLCRTRGWNFKLMATHFDGFNVPTKELNAWNMHAEFYVDLPPDRDASLKDSALGEESGTGINLFLSSDQVRFYRDRHEVAVDEVPSLVYSEVMRDVDLFTTVASIGRDESWSDQGDRSMGTLDGKFNPAEATALIALRAEILGRVIPLTKIAGRCTLRETYMDVKGQLGTYRIVLWHAGVARISDPPSSWLNIPQKELRTVELDLSDIPIEVDHRTELILRKALFLADDWKIQSPELIRQLIPE